MLLYDSVMSKVKDQNIIGGSLKKLEKIVQWFQEQEELDVEQGLDKVKEGAVLVKELKGKLQDVENEFIEIKQKLTE